MEVCQIVPINLQNTVLKKVQDMYEGSKNLARHWSLWQPIFEDQFLDLLSARGENRLATFNKIKELGSRLNVEDVGHLDTESTESLESLGYCDVANFEQNLRDSLT